MKNQVRWPFVTTTSLDNSLLDQGHAHRRERSYGSVFILALFSKFTIVQNASYITNMHVLFRRASPRLASPTHRRR